jgi:hypothetical protein
MGEENSEVHTSDQSWIQLKTMEVQFRLRRQDRQFILSILSGMRRQAAFTVNIAAKYLLQTVTLI